MKRCETKRMNEEWDLTAEGAVRIGKLSSFSAIECCSNALKQGTKCYQFCKWNGIGIAEMSILASTL